MSRRTYPGSLDRHGPSWRWRVMIDGERHTHTLPELEDADAREEWIRNKYRELKKRARRKAAGLPGNVTIEELLDQFEEEHLPGLAPNTRTSYKTSLRPLRAYFEDELGNPRLDRIRPGHIRGYLQWRRTHGPKGKKRKKPLSNRTLQKDRAILHKAFEIAVSVEYVDANPVAAVDAPKPDTRDPYLLSDAELEKLLQECAPDDMLRLYVLFLAETGARCLSEALHVRWADIDLEEGFVWIGSPDRETHRTKSGKGRWVPLTPRLEAALRDHAAEYRLRTYKGKRSPWVFHWTRTARKAVAGERIKTLYEHVMAAGKRAGIPVKEWTQHDLRHRRATTWLAEGRNPVHVKEALGHSTMQVTMGYTHLAREHLRSLVQDHRRPSAEVAGSPP